MVGRLQNPNDSYLGTYLQIWIPILLPRYSERTIGSLDVESSVARSAGDGAHRHVCSVMLCRMLSRLCGRGAAFHGLRDAWWDAVGVTLAA